MQKVRLSSCAVLLIRVLLCFLGRRLYAVCPFCCWFYATEWVTGGLLLLVCGHGRYCISVHVAGVLPALSCQCSCNTFDGRCFATVGRCLWNLLSSKLWQCDNVTVSDSSHGCAEDNLFGDHSPSWHLRVPFRNHAHLIQSAVVWKPL